MSDQDESPDFEALRAERNRRAQASLQRLADEFDVAVESFTSNYDPDACYCACSSRGPCEHKWEGEGVEFEGGLGWSVTCSRCGTTAISHSMRVGP